MTEFYKETNFKDSKIGRIPKDWGVVKLGDYIKVEGGYAFKSKDYVATGIPLIRIANVSHGHIEFDDLACLPYKYLEKYNRFSLEEGDIVIVLTRPIIGGGIKAAKIEKEHVPALLNQRVGRFRIIDKKHVVSNFLFYVIFSNIFINQVKKGLVTMNQPNISPYEIERFRIPLSPPEEQQKIAEIISTVDDAIQRVDEAIAKTERLKRGLMHELFTKGIGHEEFKDTEIGRIPKGWEAVRLGDKGITELIMGQSPPSSTYNRDKKGLPFLQGKIEFGEIYPSPTIYCSNPIKIAEPKDILLSVRAPVGEVNIAQFKCCVGRGITAIRAKQDKLHHLFLFYFLKFNGKKFEALSAGSTFKAIRRQEIENYLITLPSFPEQRKIVEILSTVDKKLELERKRKEKLERIKKGLMDLLLTGKIRAMVN